MRNESVRLGRTASRVRHLGSSARPPAACCRVKPVREPDAGNPHVRFDERREGNGLVADLGESEISDARGLASERSPCGTEIGRLVA